MWKASVAGAMAVWCAAAGAGPPSGPAKVRLLPYPDPKCVFDYTRIDRTLKEPPYGGSPIYAFLACGPKGDHVVAIVLDESAGRGRGVDTVYIDFNGNRDLTEPAERISLGSPCPVKPAGPGGSVRCALPGGARLDKRRLDVPDPTFEYALSIGGGVIRIGTCTRQRDWSAELKIYTPATTWSTDKAAAPVYRIGGSEFHFRNEHFVSEGGRGSSRSDTSIGRTYRPGATISVVGTTPYFAGSSPGVGPGSGAAWVAGGYPALRAWIETVAAGEVNRTEIDFHGY